MRAFHRILVYPVIWFRRYVLLVHLLLHRGVHWRSGEGRCSSGAGREEVKRVMVGPSRRSGAFSQSPVLAASATLAVVFWPEEVVKDPVRRTLHM